MPIADMMRSRRFVHAAGIAALAAMLFAQAAFALAACSPARASSWAQMLAAHGAESAACHEPADNANICLARCQGAEQALDKHQVKVPEISLQPVRTVRAWQEADRPIVRWALRAPTLAAGPPPRILFRSLLI